MRIRSASEERHGRPIFNDNVLFKGPRPIPRLYDSAAGPEECHNNEFDDFAKIRILPTTDEILSPSKPIYLPKKDWKQANPTAVGPQRLLDLLFRHLRFESVEILRDVVYTAAQEAFHSSPKQQSTFHRSYLLQNTRSPQDNHIQLQIDGYKPRRETLSGNRFFMYRDAQLEEMQSHEQEGLLARVSYECPNFMRGNKIYDSERLKKGMLAALLCFDTETDQLMVYFMTIHASQSTMSMDAYSGNGQKAAVQLAFPQDTNETTIEEFAMMAQNLRSHTKMLLVEFPKVLVAGFYHCLKRLQSIDTFAFEQYLAPRLSTKEIDLQIRKHIEVSEPSILQCQAPEYARQPGFAFDLSSISNTHTEALKSVTLEDLCKPRLLELLRSSTILDHGQALAFRESLLHEFALTQGPPGTGKSFLGIQLAKVLKASTSKPILVVCLTNHALDNFLGGVKDAGITGLVRVGGGSKQEWTKTYNLTGLRQKARLTPDEHWRRSRLKEERKLLLSQVETWSQDLSRQNHTGRPGWSIVEGVLNVFQPDLLKQFDLYNGATKPMSLAFNFWLDGGDLNNLHNLVTRPCPDSADATQPATKLADDDPNDMFDSMRRLALVRDKAAGDKSIWRIPSHARLTLAKTWSEEADAEAMAQWLKDKFSTLQENSRRLYAIRQQVEIRVMRQKDVVGITTTACARNWEMLKEVGFQVVLCEEAAEVMEPHALCAMLPSIQHAIYIGDPLQLRPEVSQRCMSIDVGREYRLDESLFERLSMPKDLAAPRLPLAKLSIQRRMHPDIAGLARLTYPFLRDHASTIHHKQTHGLVERMFWWDHRQPELGDVGVTKSHINPHEIEMVTGLVKYLINGNAYDRGDIAVLTPYAGQLAELHKSLRSLCHVWLNQRDRALILEEALLDQDELAPPEKDDVLMSEMLRIATVDNFQGEEAKVIILTTVRSGTGPGFLAIPNRVNVAVSRARDGFYVIGNSKTLGRVRLWQRIIDVFGSRRGFELTTKCENHPAFYHTISHPADFSELPDCPRVCDRVLPCGHPCPQMCHANRLHDEDLIPCRQQCEKVLKCGHRCLRPCGLKCGTCLVVVSNTTLSCGHFGHILCSGESSKCGAVLKRKILSCGHLYAVVCGVETNEDIICEQPCREILDCGHKCPGWCCDCSSKGHKECVEVCNSKRAVKASVLAKFGVQKQKQNRGNNQIQHTKREALRDISGNSSVHTNGAQAADEAFVASGQHLYEDKFLDILREPASNLEPVSNGSAEDISEDQNETEMNGIGVSTSEQSDPAGQSLLTDEEIFWMAAKQMNVGNITRRAPKE